MVKRTSAPNCSHGESLPGGFKGSHRVSRKLRSEKALMTAGWLDLFLFSGGGGGRVFLELRKIGSFLKQGNWIPWVGCLLQRMLACPPWCEGVIILSVQVLLVQVV